MQNTYKLPTPKQKDIEVDVSIWDACNFRLKLRSKKLLLNTEYEIDFLISALLGLIGSIWPHRGIYSRGLKNKKVVGAKYLIKTLNGIWINYLILIHIYWILRMKAVVTGLFKILYIKVGNLQEFFSYLIFWAKTSMYKNWFVLQFSCSSYEPNQKNSFDLLISSNF